MSTRNIIVSVALAAASPAFAAVSLTCTEDRQTNAMFCFATTEITEANGIRSAPLYMGGPKEVNRTAYTIAANCATGVMHLKDRKGVSFGGAGPGEGTEHSRALRRDFCAAIPEAASKGKKKR